MTTIEIIKQYLIDNGFDGLCNDELDCGCELADLEPCDVLQSNCKAGYKHPGDMEYDFYIKDYKHDNNSD